MVHSSVVDELAFAPSANWAMLINRHNLICNYLQILKPAAEDINFYASKAGLSPRMFYRLVRRHRARLQGDFAPKKIIGRGKPLSKNQEAAVAAAVRIAGAGATTKNVVDAVRNTSASFGVLPPSEYTVIDRLRRGCDLSGLNERLGYAYDWIVDACATDIYIERGAGEVEVAWIVGIINLKSGVVAGHHLCVGAPNAADVLSAIKSEWSGDRIPAITPAVVACTGAIHEQAIGAFAVRAASDGAIALYRHQGIRTGEALRYILGQKLGGVRIYSRQSARTRGERSAGAALPVVRAVVAELLRRSNELLAARQVAKLLAEEQHSAPELTRFPDPSSQ